MRKYRLRLLNAGPSRFYEFFLSNGQPFIQIGADGNLLPRPIVRNSLRLGVAERADVILDFSSASIGDEIFLQNRLEQTSGRGPTGRLLSPGVPVMRFDVHHRVVDRSRIPDTLRQLPAADPSEAVALRTWTFSNRNGAWTINNRLFDSNLVGAIVKKDSAEIWVLQTGGGNWTHPVHIHFEEFQILSRNGGAPVFEEIARKDVLRLEPRNNARVFIRFRDFTGRYVMHCHNMLHEDHAMMIWFEIQS
jgi:FtsP/CotA-like multicopper oxidase with cupredoxin domain